MNTLSERIQQAISAKIPKPTQKALAHACRISPVTVNDWISGKTKGISGKNLLAAANFLGVNPTWLASGKGSMQAGMPSMSQQTIDDMTEFDEWSDDTPLHPDDVEIPFLKAVQLSAGNGRVIMEDTSSKKLRFGKYTLKRLGISHRDAVAFAVSGNSMEPVLMDGDVVGIDMSSTDIADGKVYAVNIGGDLKIKILVKLPLGGVQIRSYNSAEYPNENYTDDKAELVTVVGKIFWSSRIWG